MVPQNLISNMIVYDNRSWLGSIGHVRGTAIPNIVLPVACVAFWSYIIYLAQVEWPEYLVFDVASAHKILGAFVSFFLIFRTNQAYNRYWHCNDCLKEIQVSTRELHQQFLVYNKGGCLGKEKDKPNWETQATQAKTDATRYVLAYCVAFKLHSRIAYDGYMMGEIDSEKKAQIDCDRARLRGLLSAEEFSIVDNMLRINHIPKGGGTLGIGGSVYEVSTDVSCRACHIMLFFLRCLAFQCALRSKTWGWLERCLNLSDGSIGKMMRAFEEMDQNITTPLPLPYCHLCKTLMFIFLLVFPIVGVSADDGLMLNVLCPTVIATAMFGLESISMEIEDPFGDDDNDFDVMRTVAAIEGSIYEVMHCRNDPTIDNFCWIQAPEDGAYKDCTTFLALKTEQSAAVAMMQGAVLAQRSPGPEDNGGSYGRGNSQGYSLLPLQMEGPGANGASGNSNPYGGGAV